MSSATRSTPKKLKFALKPKQLPVVEKEKRNWLSLPSDVTANILHRVGVFDILENAKKVCTTWCNICKDPSMWRVIYMKNHLDEYARHPLSEMCKHAVDRSQGQLADLTIVDFADDKLLHYIADRSSQLKRLELACCHNTYWTWPEALKKFPLLEELVLYSTPFPEEAIETVARCCPMLRTLKINEEAGKVWYMGIDWLSMTANNERAITIGEKFPDLRHLELIGNNISDTGLQVILDGCRHLESLDLRPCFYIDLKGELGKKCSEKIKCLKLPKDSLQGCPYIEEYKAKVTLPSTSESNLQKAMKLKFVLNSKKLWQLVKQNTRNWLDLPHHVMANILYRVASCPLFLYLTKKGLVCGVEEEEEEEEEEDRISKLPHHLIDSILERLPFEDVVRTSIISKNWRYKWTTMTELVFDDQFSKKFAKEGKFSSDEFIRIINQVFNLHNGSILKFHLHIPDMVLDRLQEVDQCMLLLSRTDVRELILTNSNEDYEVSSHVFSCLKLTKLTLKNCFVKLPLMFERFPNLEYLDLEDIEFGANLGGTEINLPQLKMLSLDYCINVDNFNIKATKMQNLFVVGCHDAMLLRLCDSPAIFQLHISFEEPIEGLVRAERINLARMLNKLPRVEVLEMDGEFLKDVIIEEKIPKWLPLAYSSLKLLHLQCIQLGDLSQLHGVLCLLRNSQNLKRLLMQFSACKYPPVDVESASNHLEAPNCLEFTMNQLQTVTILYLEGSRPELLFIKLLLAHSLSLKMFRIALGASQKGLDIGKDVMEFPRASTESQVRFL